MRKETEGFLFDVHEGNDAVVLWIYQDDGALLRLEADFQPRIYARGARSALKAVGAELLRCGALRSWRLTEGIEFWTGKAIEVGEFIPRRYEDQRRVVNRLSAELHESALYNADLQPPQYYLYTSDLFPLCRLAVEYEGDRIETVHCLSCMWEPNYRLPALRVLEMKLGHSKFLPLGKGNSLILSSDGLCCELQPRTWRELLETVNEALCKVDPDVILTEHGDENIFPSLIQAAKRENLPLMFDRDVVPTERIVVRDGKSYFSYGRILYKPPSYLCYGRWHIDAATSFIAGETELDGLIELSRLSRLPLQKAARTSPGTAMNSIECYHAFKNRVLIPYAKAEPEKYKTAWELLLADKGGLTYVQPVGAFENVAEIDYASMYPTLMMKKNLSPETVRCSCCSNSRVPEIGYNVCEKREGLLPLALRPILELRRAYKRLKRASQGEEREIYDRRQHALKWLLVTCFGYTGYRNARFGRIEAHEATTAWGRELLLQAKELAEGRGFHLLHALTDSLWISKPRMTEEEVLALCHDITRATDVEMSLEGIYRWIVFLPSKENGRRGVACRFFGRFQDREMKIRGLLCRRHDTPPFVRDAQMALLQLMSEAESLEQCRERIPQAHALLERREQELESGRVTAAELLTVRRLSKDPEAYKVRTLAAEAARQLVQAGIKLHPGEMIGYVVVDGSDSGCRVLTEAFIERATGYDVGHYKKLLRAAADEVLRFEYDPR
jgi:DNA polymerase-2